MSTPDRDRIAEVIRQGVEAKVARAQELADARAKLEADRQRHAAEEAANVKAVEEAEKRALAVGLDLSTLAEMGLVQRRSRRRSTKNSAKGVRRASAGKGAAAAKADPIGGSNTQTPSGRSQSESAS